MFNPFKKSAEIVEVNNQEIFTMPYTLIGSCRTGKTHLILNKTWHESIDDFKIIVMKTNEAEGWNHTYKIPLSIAGVNCIEILLQRKTPQSIILTYNIHESELNTLSVIHLANMLSNNRRKLRLIFDEPTAYMSPELINTIENKDTNITINATFQAIFQMKRCGFKDIPEDNIIYTLCTDHESTQQAITLLNIKMTKGEMLQNFKLGDYHAKINGEFYSGKISTI